MDEKKVTSSESKKNITTPYILKGEFFEILKQDGEAVTVQCRKCPQKNIYKGSVKSTGNFHMHIKRKHPESLQRLQELKLKSFMDRKVKIPDRLREHTLFTILQNKKNNEIYQMTSELPTSSHISTRHSVIQNLEKNSYNQPINCKKTKKIKLENQNDSKNHFNIQYGLPNKNNEHFLSQQNNFSTIQNNSMKTNKLTPIRNEKHNFDQPTKSLNNFYPYPQNTNNFNSITTSPSHNHNYVYQKNSTASTQQMSNNNNPIAATLAASMILSPTQDLLGKIDNHLKSIERQLHLRNQIETNKIYLDLAKFKYLHPNFAFQG